MFTLIAALDQNHAIGHQGQLLFHLKDDLRFFKETTSGHPVVMGRKTWESLPGKLPGRENIVITRSPGRIQPKPPKHPASALIQPKPPKHPTSAPPPLKTPENSPKAQSPDQTITNLPDFITKHLSTPEEYFVIGGAEIYRQFLPVANRLLLTEVATAAPEADTYFPAFNPNNYTHKILQESTENGIKFAIVEYTRKTPSNEGAAMV